MVVGKKWTHVMVPVGQLFFVSEVGGGWGLVDRLTALERTLLGRQQNIGVVLQEISVVQLTLVILYIFVYCEIEALYVRMCMWGCEKKPTMSDTACIGV